MICRELGALFVHVPKAAGQSVERVLLAEMGLDWETRAPTLLAPNQDAAKGPPRLAHLTAEEYVRLGWLSEEEFRGLFKFAFVRNPWARLVSEYRYRGLAPAVGFREFVLERFPGPAEDDYENCEDHYRHVLPQSTFVYDKEGKCLVDFVGRFETLVPDFANVARKLSLRCQELPHSNISRRVPRRRSIQDLLRRPLGRAPLGEPDYVAFFDADTRSFVERRYEEDIARFGYRFGGL